MGHPHAHPGGLVAPSGPDVFLERALTGGDPLLDASEEEEREPDAVEGVGCLLFFEGGREDVACGGPLRPLEEAQPLRALIYCHPASLTGKRTVAVAHSPVWSPRGNPGDLDTSFSGDGKRAIDFGGTDSANLVGRGGGVGDGTFCVARLRRGPAPGLEADAYRRLTA